MTCSKKSKNKKKRKAVFFQTDIYSCSVVSLTRDTQRILCLPYSKTALPYNSSAYGPEHGVTASLVSSLQMRKRQTGVTRPVCPPSSLPLSHGKPFRAPRRPCVSFSFFDTRLDGYCPLRDDAVVIGGDWIPTYLLSAFRAYPAERARAVDRLTTPEDVRVNLFSTCRSSHSRPFPSPFRLARQHLARVCTIVVSPLLLIG